MGLEIGRLAGGRESIVDAAAGAGLLRYNRRNVPLEEGSLWPDPRVKVHEALEARDYNRLIALALRAESDLSLSSYISRD